MAIWKHRYKNTLKLEWGDLLHLYISMCHLYVQCTSILNNITTVHDVISNAVCYDLIGMQVGL